jgi:hypothetical protein
MATQFVAINRFHAFILDRLGIKSTVGWRHSWRPPKRATAAFPRTLIEPRKKERETFKRAVITNGLSASLDFGNWQVPKKDLVGTLQVLLQEQRLKLAADLSEVPTLVDELMNFRMKPLSPSTDPLLAWRERSQDDLIFALAVAAWWIERGRLTLWVR